MKSVSCASNRWICLVCPTYGQLPWYPPQYLLSPTSSKLRHVIHTVRTPTATSLTVPPLNPFLHTDFLRRTPGSPSSGDLSLGEGRNTVPWTTTTLRANSGHVRCNDHWLTLCTLVVFVVDDIRRKASRDPRVRSGPFKA